MKSFKTTKENERKKPVLFFIWERKIIWKGEAMSHYLFISDAAKEVKVESHVLRYWEEELHLPIKRNELGHRYYTEEDVDRFKEIKDLKERGLQLKAIKMILKDGKLDILPSGGGIKRESAALKGQGTEERQEASKTEEKGRESVPDRAAEQESSKTEEKERGSVPDREAEQESAGTEEKGRGSVPDRATEQEASKTEAKGRGSVPDRAMEQESSKTEAKGRGSASDGAEPQEDESVRDSADAEERENVSPNIPDQRQVGMKEENCGETADEARAVGNAAEEKRELPEASECGEEQKGLAIDIIGCRNPRVVEESKEDKSRRLQWLLQQLIRETLQENNGELCNQIRESVVKELDYQFRMQEEREELRDRRMAERDEEHYKKMDELLRKKSRKAFPIGGKKKKSAP